MPEHGTMSDQLTTLIRQRRTVVPSVRPVSQIVLELSGAEPEALFQAARKDVLRWMQKRAGGRIPAGAWDGVGFRVEDVGAQFAAAVTLDEPSYWAARLDDADKAIAQRTWATEIGLGINALGQVLFGVRLQCITRGEDAVFVPSVPGFARQVADNTETLLDGRRINTSPWVVDNEDDVEELVNFLEDPRRRHDVIVFSLLADETNSSTAAVPVPHVLRLAFGSTHFVVLTGPSAFHLTERVGKEFSVFNQAVRTYRPGLEIDNDEPSQHPLALAHRIQDWKGEGPQAFADFLVSTQLRKSVASTNLENTLPSFLTVRQIATERQREKVRAAGVSDADSLELAESVIEDLEAQLQEQKELDDGLLEAATEDIRQAQADAEEARAQMSGMRARMEYLEAVASDTKRKGTSIPGSLEDLEDWSRKHLSGRVVIHNRGLRAAKNSEFEDVAFVYRVLLMLRDRYVPMRRDGGKDLVAEFEKACVDLGLDDTPSFSGTRYGEEGDKYIVKHAGRKRLLERHLKGRNTRDPRHGFRIYYFWDEDSEQVVVGWLPGHLPTRAT